VARRTNLPDGSPLSVTGLGIRDSLTVLKCRPLTNTETFRHLTCGSCRSRKVSVCPLTQTFADGKMNARDAEMGLRVCVPEADASVPAAVAAAIATTATTTALKYPNRVIVVSFEWVGAKIEITVFLARPDTRRKDRLGRSTRWQESINAPVLVTCAQSR
jgi:hypothetical protein